MRTLLTPSMLNVIVDNLKKGNNEGRLFEKMCIRDRSSEKLPASRPKKLPLAKILTLCYTENGS